MRKAYFILFLIISLDAASNTLELKDKSAEEIINTRMKIMSSINQISQKIYKQLNKSDFSILEINTLELKDSAIKFKQLFPDNSMGGKAKKKFGKIEFYLINLMIFSLMILI